MKTAEFSYGCRYFLLIRLFTFVCVKISKDRKMKHLIGQDLVNLSEIKGNDTGLLTGNIIKVLEELSLFVTSPYFYHLQTFLTSK